MASNFDAEFASAVEIITDTFAERDSLGNFDPVSIRLHRSQQPFHWNGVSVGPLTERLVEIGGRIESREACVIEGATNALVTGDMPLPEKTQITVPNYEERPFHPVPEECQYGEPMTKLSLIRVPLKSMDNFHEQRGA